MLNSVKSLLHTHIHIYIAVQLCKSSVNLAGLMLPYSVFPDNSLSYTVYIYIYMYRYIDISLYIHIYIFLC